MRLLIVLTSHCKTAVAHAIIITSSNIGFSRKKSTLPAPIMQSIPCPIKIGMYSVITTDAAENTDRIIKRVYGLRYMKISLRVLLFSCVCALLFILRIINLPGTLRSSQAVGCVCPRRLANPSSSTIIISACFMEAVRCDTINTVGLLWMFLSAALSFASVAKSSADELSSSIRISAFFVSARAIVRRCLSSRQIAPALLDNAVQSVFL